MFQSLIAIAFLQVALSVPAGIMEFKPMGVKPTEPARGPIAFFKNVRNTLQNNNLFFGKPEEQAPRPIIDNNKNPISYKQAEPSKIVESSANADSGLTTAQHQARYKTAPAQPAQPEEPLMDLQDMQKEFQKIRSGQSTLTPAEQDALVDKMSQHVGKLKSQLIDQGNQIDAEQKKILPSIPLSREEQTSFALATKRQELAAMKTKLETEDFPDVKRMSNEQLKSRALDTRKKKLQKNIEQKQIEIQQLEEQLKGLKAEGLSPKEQMLNDLEAEKMNAQILQDFADKVKSGYKPTTEETEQYQQLADKMLSRSQERNAQLDAAKAPKEQTWSEYLGLNNWGW